MFVKGYFGDEMKLDPEMAKRGVSPSRRLWNEGKDGHVVVPYEIGK